MKWVTHSQIASTWKDYEILATGEGMKLERWGEFVLARPDPQILWPKRNAALWKEAHATYHRSGEGGGSWTYRATLPDHWTIGYRELRFKIRPTNFKHTGLFPEQASNWDWIQTQVRKAGTGGGAPRILNLFGYTGAASVAAAAAGAQVTHVDAAKGMVEWCRDNAVLSGLGDRSLRLLVDDCLKFVLREGRRGSRYDGILMDPPSYGRGSRGELWKFETHLWELLTASAALLSERARFFLVNAYTTGLSPTILAQVLHAVLGDREGTLTSGENLLPIEEGGELPCGIFSRWEAQGGG